MSTEARRLLIRGFVQGVGYRESMCRIALSLGICGWVRNRLDGCVEAVVEGDPGAVEQIVEWAREGPPAARVESVEVLPEVPGKRQRFDRRPTA